MGSCGNLQIVGDSRHGGQAVGGELCLAGLAADIAQEEPGLVGALATLVEAKTRLADGVGSRLVLRQTNDAEVEARVLGVARFGPYTGEGHSCFPGLEQVNTLEGGAHVGRAGETWYLL